MSVSSLGARISRTHPAMSGRPPSSAAHREPLHGLYPVEQSFSWWQNTGVSLRSHPPHIRRRSCLLATLPWLHFPALATDAPLRAAMRRAEALRDEALRAGDQPFGAVVLRGEIIVGAAPSRVVTATDLTAHAEMEAISERYKRRRKLLHALARAGGTMSRNVNCNRRERHALAQRSDAPPARSLGLRDCWPAHPADGRRPGRYGADHQGTATASWRSFGMRRTMRLNQISKGRLPVAAVTRATLASA